jgi:hypothetical protein
MKKQDVPRSLAINISAALLQAIQIHRLTYLDVSEDVHIIRWRE